MNTNLPLKNAPGRQKTHGLSDHLLYGVWNAMKDRCVNKKSKYYKHYGGRGISVCKEWVKDFKKFYDWAIGTWRKGLDIDRINNDGNYEPSNCRFVSRCTNSRNRRSNIVFEYMGRSQTITEWAEDMEIDYAKLYIEIKKSKKETPAEILHRFIYNIEY